MKLSYRDIVLIGKVLAALLLTPLLSIPLLFGFAVFGATMTVTLGAWFLSGDQVLPVDPLVAWVFALAVSFVLSCRVVFFGFKENPRTEKFDLRATSVVIWLAKVTGYMFMFYFLIGFITTFPSYDPDAPEEVTQALFAAAREQYKLHYLIAFIASAYVAFIETRKMMKEGKQTQQ